MSPVHKPISGSAPVLLSTSPPSSSTSSLSSIGQDVGEHARLRQQQPPARRRTTRPQVQLDRVLFLKHFPYKDIKRATDGFQWIMYTNSHMAAYKARFQDAGVVLVKEIRDYNQGKDVFYREVQLLGRLHHRHLLALKGFSTGHRRGIVAAVFGSMGFLGRYLVQ